MANHHPLTPSQIVAMAPLKTCQVVDDVGQWQGQQLQLWPPTAALGFWIGVWMF